MNITRICPVLCKHAYSLKHGFLTELEKKRNLSLPFGQGRPQFYLPRLIACPIGIVIHKFYINDKEEMMKCNVDSAVKFSTFHNIDIKILVHTLLLANQWTNCCIRTRQIFTLTVFCHPVTLEWFSIQILLNSEIFILLLNLSLKHLKAQITCYELKVDLSPIMLKEISHNSLKISKFMRICMENHSSMTVWQKLFFSYKSFKFWATFAMASFVIYGWNFTGYLILICSFSSC